MLRFLCKSYLRSLNLAVVLIGFTLVIASISALLNDGGYSHTQSGNPTEYAGMYASSGIIFGVLLLTCASCILTGISQERRGVLCCSVLVYMVISVILLVEGSGLTVVVSSLHQVADNCRVQGSLGLTGLNRYVNDFELGVFDACCSEVAPQRDECAPTAAASARYAAPVLCYYDADAYDAGRRIDEDDDDNSDEVCEKFVVEHFCRNKTDFPTFEKNVYEFARDNFAELARMFIVLGTFLFVAFVGGFYLYCTTNRARAHQEIIVTEYTILNDQSQA